jgi:hypothetical protein
MSMSEAGHFNPHHEFIRDTKAEIYGRFADILKVGTYYPAKCDTSAEMVSPAEALMELHQQIMNAPS